ncbi:hypothetical protein C1637_17750 [Chryseobacterium lactis]|uniref:T9SS C-terminal target domain-containing protein n=1 Tax=Chryseobacterium lactis TaxID=1241981 RepID=A0A3G6RHF2_CHRLC|nr:T9SS type A sorting domain-containing protein [Chryseobacterium lactis]AZA82921.1 T9SS C-terminal target domain-containing protein [Chryseobacterium lactis]AZB03303.1 T9SS C-terminal target domain-containing protein [Chryseobacterium lactis]PNW12411.1 hypothetical protein C1637_17750 [Chryseobacterium lactis]
MKKTLFSIAMFATGLVFGQINLIHTFPTTEDAAMYINDTQLVYCTQLDYTSVLKIYNQSYNLLKTVNIPVPAGYNGDMLFIKDESYQISKNIFNTNDKLEFIVYFRAPGTQASKLLIVDEDAAVVKDFPGTYRSEFTKIYHDPTDNTNKLKLFNETTLQTEIYSLPTSTLGSKEITDASKNKLVAFPIPAKTTLKITNPKNSSNKVEVYDTTGKLVLNKSFSNHEEAITLNVESLNSGLYFYKIGELSSKFIKE